MSMTKTSPTLGLPIKPIRPSERSQPANQSSSGLDTSNLSPGAAARFEKLIHSIDSFTEAVHNKSIALPERK